MPDLPLKVMITSVTRTVLSTSPACRTKAWACASGIYHQPYDWRPPTRTAEFDDQEPQLQNEIREMMKGLILRVNFTLGV